MLKPSRPHLVEKSMRKLGLDETGTMRVLQDTWLATFILTVKTHLGTSLGECPAFHTVVLMIKRPFDNVGAESSRPQGSAEGWTKV